ncbi:sensor histidine kinase/response regulator [Myxococcus stipitatus DSM 14675]|uniref:histidine kinase n=1 Tax=Myxococcus stipitatus (strain DSM 14675 / JCM 12634 / Mx s8) TaxID=1278073 RepID=L7UIC1_MYXSD|nr:ATP-binding protein [Myxococcus stipitatus]AGC46209.1 sensor histidine kinase/response regulator [Myxococcus stipitatus DSM 14675]
MEDDGNQWTGAEEARLRELLAAMEAANQGDFSRRVPVLGTHPLMDRLAETFNAGAARLTSLTQSVSRVAHEVGVEGRLGGQVDVPETSGAWRELADGVNVLASSLTAQVRDLIRVSGAVARGDLSQSLTVEVRGESLVLKNIVNTMVERLTAFAREVNRVARQVGVEGSPEDVSTPDGLLGVWKDFNDNVGFTEKLALASRHKSAFLANISHELRTPLNSLLILAKLLSEDSAHRLGPKEAEYARTIHASGVDLLSLINDLLDLSKVEAGQLRVEPAEVSLTEVKSLLERDFQHVAEQKGLGFSVTLVGALPTKVRTDSMRLRQVLKNLLANAFKFTHQGRVELRISQVNPGLFHFESEMLNRADGVLAFSVVDTGIGIAQDSLQRIFEAFQQAELSTSRQYGGTGLGLSISRELARLLGGELHVASELGRGSTFTLYLPDIYVETAAPGARTAKGAPVELEAADIPVLGRTESPALVSNGTAAMATVPLAMDAASGAGPGALVPTSERGLRGRVLVVDDNIREAFSLISVLESRGLESLHAEAASEALRMLWDFPEMDGLLWLTSVAEADYEIIRSLRKDARFGALPIVVVMSQSQDEARARCLDAGASDCVSRPVDIDQVIALLRRDPRSGTRGEAAR